MICVMERHQMLQCMLTTGKNLSIGLGDLRVLLLKLVVISVKYVSRRALWEARFGKDEYVDWDLVEGLPPCKNVLGSCSEWLGLLRFCRWDELSKKPEALIPGMLLGLRRHMRECSLDAGGTDGWTLACKAFLLMLVQGVSSMHALEVLTCDAFKRNTHAGCTMLLAKQARFLLFFWWGVRGADTLGFGWCRRRTCTRPRSTRRPCSLCWTSARWTRAGWSRRCSWCRPRRTTGSCV